MGCVCSRRQSLRRPEDQRQPGPEAIRKNIIKVVVRLVLWNWQMLDLHARLWQAHNVFFEKFAVSLFCFANELFCVNDEKYKLDHCLVVLLRCSALFSSNRLEYEIFRLWYKP